MIELLREKYLLKRKVGRGGMAEIYLAVDKLTGEYVAIKILHPEKKNSYSDRKRFLEEINLTKKVESPYVVKIKDWMWNDDLQYIVMEYIEGHTLKDYIQSKTKLTTDETVDFARQISLGFNAIHNAGIVHRDLKATNILVTNHGQIKIIDFGIAITDETERLTKTDNIIASPQYIAPEIVSQEEPTTRSDIYSLGILMFEMLTGNLPFIGKDAYATIMMHKQREVPHVNKIFSSVPQSLSNVIIKATHKSPDKRHQTMFDFYKDVDSSLENSRLYEPLINFDAKPKKTFKDVVNSKWTMVGIISSIIVILIIVIAVLAAEVI